MNIQTGIIVLSISTLLFSCNSNNSAKRIETSEAVEVSEASGEKYSLVAEESQINWRGTKPTGEHHGYINFSDGILMLDENKITGGRFVIDMNSIVDEDLEDEEMNAKLTGHLKSEDFFHVEEYPEGVFELTSVKKSSINTSESDDSNMEYEITGNLTLRGVTKSITFPANIEISENNITAQSNEFSLDRTLWNVNFQSKKVFAELKDKFIHDDMHIKLNLKFRKN